MTKEIMEIMDKAEKKYLDIVREHGCLNKLADRYLRELRGAGSSIISDMNACKRLGLIYKVQVDTVRVNLAKRVDKAIKKAYAIQTEKFCDGSEEEFEIQFWMYKSNLTREEAEAFVADLDSEEE